MTAAILPLAWRNLRRHRLRSLITIVGIAIGLAALLFLWGLNDGLNNTMVRNFQTTFIGSLQIRQQGILTHPKPDAHLAHPDKVSAALAAAGIDRWTPRLQRFALAAGVETSTGTLLVGIDPRRELATTRIATTVARGRFLVAEDTYACVLGAISARNLAIDIGDPVILLTQGHDGALAAERFTLVGIMDSGTPEIDRSLVLAPLATLQEMLGLYGRLTNVVAVAPEGRLAQVTATLRQALDGEGLEVQSWDDMFPALRESMALENSFYYVFLGVVLVIVVAGVLNTVLVSMLERQREFGILMAIGTRSVEIGAMVAAESLLLGTAGTALGSLVGLGLVGLYGYIGIDLSFMSEFLKTAYLHPVVYTEINTDHLLVTLLAVLVTTSVASLYPAWKAMRLQPVEAMCYV